MIADGDVIDGFAGPGGWDVAARRLGLDPLGIELDDAACATRAAAGLRTFQADVSALDPQRFAPVRGAIFSPPCPSFSMAGKGSGRSAIPLYQEAMVRMAVEAKSIDRAELDAMCDDPRAHLILEPLRWALALRPEWVACEQVEPCLPLWETTAWCLRHVGYRTWCGVLSAERYGVPQTRRRAILMASLSRQPVEPVASHQRYVPPRVKAKQGESLFDAPEPERIVLPEDRELAPWVSMAEALGWGMTARPSVSVMAQGQTGGPKPLGGGSGSDALLKREQAEGRWDSQDRVGFPRRAESDTGWDHETAPTFTGENGIEYRERDLRSASQPAPVVTEKSRSWTRFPSRADEAAPAVTGQERVAGPSRDQEPRSVDDPSYTIRTATGSGDPGVGRTPGVQWVSGRPATTVAGGHGWVDGESRPENSGQAVRVSVDEAAVLQDFPVGYPWQGSRTAVYRQIGDAIPPGLARAVLEGLIG